MKQLLFLLTLLPLCSFGQNIELRISDFETNEPLPFANIYFQHAGVGASTDMLGRASFNASELIASDSVIVSYIGYKTQVWFFAKTDAKPPIEIKLVSATQQLSEVVVTYVKPPKPEKIIKTAIKKTAQNYNEQAVMYTSLYRETIKENGDYIQLNEAIAKTYYTGYPQKKLDRQIWKDWYYDDSYAFEMEGNRYFYPLLKDFNTKEDQQRIVASRHSDNLSKHGIEPSLVGGPLLLFAFDKIKYQYDFFNPSVIKKYHFKHENSESMNGESCYVISFYPKSKSRKFVVDQGRKNKSAIYIGRLFIAKESFALLKFEYKLAVDRDFGFFAKRMPLDYQVEMSYKNRDGRYGIERIKLSETKKVGTKENGEAILHEANKELFVLDLQSEAARPFPDSTLFRSTRFSSIRHYQENYNPGYWDNAAFNDSLPLSKKLITDLSIDQSLSAQFQNFNQAQKQALPKPTAFKEYHAFDYHNDTVVDSLHWMALPKYEAKLKRHLAEETKYAKNEWVEDKKYQKKLFQLLNTFYPAEEDRDKSVQTNTYFLDEDSLSQDIFYYQKDSVAKIEVINLSQFKEKRPTIFIKRIIPSPSRKRIAVQFEKPGLLGDFVAIMSFGGNTVLDELSNIYTIQWQSDSIVLYTKTNSIGSARELRLRNVTDKTDSQIYLESDPKFDVEVIRRGAELLCTIQSKTENELYLINEDSKQRSLQLIQKRKNGVIVDVKIEEDLYLLINDENTGSSIEQVPLNDLANRSLLAKSATKDYILDMLPVGDKIVVLVYENSIPKIKYLPKGEAQWIDLEFKFGIGAYNLIAKDSTSNGFFFSFSAPSQPYTKYKYDFGSAKLSTVSKPSRVKPIYYEYAAANRVWAKGHDGAKIPITIVKNRAASNRSAGLILKTYGAYGAHTLPAFNAQDAILLEQGYTIAYAHVRGESIMGPAWYKSGRQLQKEHAILDYLSCAEFLIEKKYTSPEGLIGYGNSAGGMVVGQAINLKPALFNTVILDHPYLDVINTMMNDQLPLTIDEYKEWGNPQEELVYDYILQYSPYQNIKRQHYPNVLLIASYLDYQTPIWQAAKYAAKLRQHNLSSSEILLLTDMTSGHIGNTTGKEWIKVFAETYSFVKQKIKNPTTEKSGK